MAKIIYTKTDEAPALATYSLLPIVQAFAASADVELETRDISLAGRIIARFPEYLTEEQRIGDALAELGELAKTPEANIIKLPNISASIPQLKAAIAELQAKGYALPDYPEEPETEEEKKAKAIYDTIKGSAVNPVLREGNSDRRAPKAVKAYAKKNPHSMGAWSADSKTHVATMGEGDFRSNEKSVTVPEAGLSALNIQHTDASGTSYGPQRGNVALEAGESHRLYLYEQEESWWSFLSAQVPETKEQGILFSLHMKATMMKVSDPIIFGHAVKVFFKNVFDKHSAVPWKNWGWM